MARCDFLGLSANTRYHLVAVRARFLRLAHHRLDGGAHVDAEGVGDVRAHCRHARCARRLAQAGEHRQRPANLSLGTYGTRIQGISASDTNGN